MDSQASWTFRILFNDALNLETGGQVNRETFQPCLCPLNLVKVLPSSFPFFFFFKPHSFSTASSSNAFCIFSGNSLPGRNGSSLKRMSGVLLLQKRPHSELFITHKEEIVTKLHLFWQKDTNARCGAHLFCHSSQPFLG